MKRYIQFIAPFFFINAAIADVPMVMIVDGSQRYAEEVIAVASSSIGDMDNPQQAHAKIFQQEDGKEKAEKYIEYLGNLVRKKKPETTISTKYKAIYDHLDKQQSLAHRHRFHTNNVINEKLKKEFLEKLRQERSKYGKMEYEEKKAVIIENYKASEKMLQNSKLIEHFRPTVPNIDDIFRGLDIYACAPYVRKLEIRPASGYIYNEMEGSTYEAVGFKQIEKQLLASQDKNRAFEYASYVIQDDINPTMPRWSFWDRIYNYKNLVKAYVNFISMDEIKSYSNKNCKRYSKFVIEESTYRPNRK